MGIRGMLALVCTWFVVLMLGAAVALGDNGTTVLRGTFASNETFLVNGTVTLYFFTCDEQRLQFADGSAQDTAHCRLNAGQTPPRSAAQASPAGGYESDFFVNHASGFVGNPIATSWHGVATPSGNVTMVASFA